MTKMHEASALSTEPRVLQQQFYLQQFNLQQFYLQQFYLLTSSALAHLTNNDEPGETLLCGLDLNFPPQGENGCPPASAC